MTARDSARCQGAGTVVDVPDGRIIDCPTCHRPRTVRYGKIPHHGTVLTKNARQHDLFLSRYRQLGLDVLDGAALRRT